MELRPVLPRPTTVTAVTNIYLLLSLLLVQLVSCDRPPQLERAESGSEKSTNSQRTQSKRSLDDYDEGGYFQPSSYFQSDLAHGHHRRPEERIRYRPGLR